MTVYARKIETTDDIFKNKQIVVSSFDAEGNEDILHSNSLPDNIVLCNGCNGNIYPEYGFMVYLDEEQLRQNQPYDVYHEDCLGLFKGIVKVE